MKCQTPNDVEIALSTLPKDLSETYRRILLKILDEGEATAKTAEKILRWLIGSMRPLQLSELEEAIMIESGTSMLNEKLRITTTSILASCGSLVEEFQDQDGLRRVKLSHSTVGVSTSFALSFHCTKLLFFLPGISSIRDSGLPGEI